MKSYSNIKPWLYDCKILLLFLKIKNHCYLRVDTSLFQFSHLKNEDHKWTYFKKLFGELNVSVCKWLRKIWYVVDLRYCFPQSYIRMKRSLRNILKKKKKKKYPEQFIKFFSKYFCIAFSLIVHILESEEVSVSHPFLDEWSCVDNNQTKLQVFYLCNEHIYSYFIQW